MTVHIDMIPHSMDETRVAYEAYCIQCLSYFGWSQHYNETRAAVDRHTCNPQILKQEKEHMTDITGSIGSPTHTAISPSTTPKPYATSKPT